MYLHKAAVGDYWQRQQIADRALSLLGTRYHLLNFNCEHAANWAQTGRPESPQLKGAFAVGAIIIFLILMA